MGVAERSSSDYGSSGSVWDDLRCIRSRGGFQRAERSDLLGTLGLEAFSRMEPGKAFDLALTALREEVELRVGLLAVLFPPSVTDEGRVLAAASLQHLMLNDGSNKPNFSRVRAMIGKPASRKPDYIRREEDKFLRNIVVDVCRKEKQVYRDLPKGSPKALIYNQLVNVWNASKLVWLHYQERDDVNAKRPNQQFESLVGDLVGELKIYKNRRDQIRGRLDCKLLYDVIGHYEHNLLPLTIQDLPADRKEVLLLPLDLDSNGDLISIDAQKAWKALRLHGMGWTPWEDDCYFILMPKTVAVLAAIVATIGNDDDFWRELGPFNFLPFVINSDLERRLRRKLGEKS